MANNPYINKVEYAGQTIMDLTGDTVTPSDVLNGITFHDRSGAPLQGNLITHDVYDGLDSTSSSDALSANQGKILNDKVEKTVYETGISLSASNITTDTSLLSYGSGIYKLAGTKSTYLPERYGTLLKFNTGADYGVVILFSSEAGRIHFRHFHGNEWHAGWYSLTGTLES